MLVYYSKTSQKDIRHVIKYATSAHYVPIMRRSPLNMCSHTLIHIIYKVPCNSLKYRWIHYVLANETGKLAMVITLNGASDIISCILDVAGIISWCGYRLLQSFAHIYKLQLTEIIDLLIQTNCQRFKSKS